MKKNKKKSGLKGVQERPRLSIFRSNTCMYVQVIDDTVGKTILGCNSNFLNVDKNTKSKDKKIRKHVTIEMANQLGKKVAELAKQKNITKIVFDRSGYLYHGRVKALAEGAREGGLIF